MSNYLSRLQSFLENMKSFEFVSPHPRPLFGTVNGANSRSTNVCELDLLKDQHEQW